MSDHDNLLKDNIKDKFKELIEIAGTNGKFQKVLFCLLTVVAFVSCLSLLAVSLNKERPHFNCYDKQDFEDGKDYEKYKTNPKRYKIIHNEDCVKDSCSKWEGFKSEIFSLIYIH